MRCDLQIHGASAGDLRAVDPLVQALMAQGAQPAVSAWTQTGRAMAGRLWPELPFLKPPLPGGARRSLRRLQPRVLVLELMELWPHWVAACRAEGVPVGIIDGRVTHKSLRIARWLGPAARSLAFFCARTEVDAEGAARLGVPEDRIQVCGNGKYDGVPVSPPPPSDALQVACATERGVPELILGSLHPDEEAEALSQLAASGLTAVIAPRYPKRAGALLKRAQRLGVSTRLRSASAKPARWVVLDTMGELASVYALGSVAVVGGTFGRRGGQNLIEPAAWGLPVIYGPAHETVRVEAEALAGRGGHPVLTWSEAFKRAQELIVEPGPDSRQALPALTGATARHLKVITPLIGGLDL